MSGNSAVAKEEDNTMKWLDELAFLSKELKKEGKIDDTDLAQLMFAIMNAREDLAEK